MSPTLSEGTKSPFTGWANRATPMSVESSGHDAEVPSALTLALYCPDRPRRRTMTPSPLSKERLGVAAANRSIRRFLTPMG